VIKLSRLKKLPVLISAFAAVIMLIALIITSASALWMAIWVSATIVGFFLLGWGLRRAILSGMPPEEEEVMPGMERPLEETPMEEEARASRESPMEKATAETESKMMDEEDEMNSLDDYDDENFNDDDYINDPVEDSFLDD